MGTDLCLKQGEKHRSLQHVYQSVPQTNKQSADSSARLCVFAKRSGFTATRSHLERLGSSVFGSRKATLRSPGDGTGRRRLPRSRWRDGRWKAGLRARTWPGAERSREPRLSSWRGRAAKSESRGDFIGGAPSTATRPRQRAGKSSRFPLQPSARRRSNPRAPRSRSPAPCPRRAARRPAPASARARTPAQAHTRTHTHARLRVGQSLAPADPLPNSPGRRSRCRRRRASLLLSKHLGGDMRPAPLAGASGPRLYVALQAPLLRGSQVRKSFRLPLGGFGVEGGGSLAFIRPKAPRGSRPARRPWDTRARCAAPARTSGSALSPPPRPTPPGVAAPTNLFFFSRKIQGEGERAAGLGL